LVFQIVCTLATIIEYLDRHGTAFSFVTALLLAGLTGVYVIFTARLASSQEQATRASIEPVVIARTASTEEGLSVTLKNASTAVAAGIRLYTGTGSIATVRERASDVAVLANPYGLLPPLGASDITFSLFGIEDVVQMSVGPGAPDPPELRRVAMGPGALVEIDESDNPFNPHPCLSAVIVVHERTNPQDFVDAELARRRPGRELGTREERVAHIAANYEALNTAEREGRIPAGQYEWVTVFDLRGHPEFTGTPPPSNVFDGPRDRWYDLRPGGGFAERDHGSAAA
jgi:hypothetical protein